MNDAEDHHLMPSILTAFRRSGQNSSNVAPPPQSSKGASAPTLPPVVSPPAALVTPGGTDHTALRKRAVDLFTFLRELVSLRTTVVRNCESYDRVLWIDEVPPGQPGQTASGGGAMVRPVQGASFGGNSSWWQHIYASLNLSQ